ncbi:NADH dehydrogenase [ubiquinone] 1 alpha subcomplex subunit 2 [Ictidomys tridecemlineatus]|uniref:NADH dehydrogenase [ubiquinone] 1 alpha subcomplex subunit 2 n=1 Tax=Ictidomys tridecemlineatus TaxID=43179 RepID=I3N724_ICTTR|nr:NADH dehydrogenase [ubiquinone] 1 alpha subcomplex subunit 2-like [Ictidomys tridecemlineatus]XP_005322938.1 NADH dehydrogenase [ubiquinone] 1 alpha subcomplex subunit 2-like [Ictidomys tridecemlineatus]KAG3261389.1 NDUFA2 [Ictidomys tridecemlineatus]KAG3261390.1 NADH dehydrogenase [ubiquinone] 1 alpha subcomplex subunit 2-like [Ictidomys tridecemlineatus]KAG3261391.1 NDUFA2 [Ictidomys tridecemlineatus]KAG3261392.1 NADH dehydrogenase [ubiquinone] 1 alpha subcomplex subunit 2-like [Ictidomys
MAAAAAGGAAAGAKLGLREIRIHLCECSPCSQGIRDLIEKRFVELKKANPDLPILIRECSDVQPKLWARYPFLQDKNVSLNTFNAHQVTRTLENVLSGKA